MARKNKKSRPQHIIYIFLVQNNICLTVSENDMLSKYTPAEWVGLVWKLAFGHGEYPTKMWLDAGDVSTIKFVPRASGWRWKEAGAAAHGLSCFPGEQCQWTSAGAELPKRDWHDDVETIRWKRTYDALRWHNKMPHWYFLVQEQFQQSPKVAITLQCVRSERRISSSTLHVSNICRELSNKKNNNKNTHCWIHQESVQWHSTKSSRPTFQESIRCYLKAMVSCWTDGQQQLIWWIAAKNTGGFWAIITYFGLFSRFICKKWHWAKVTWNELSNPTHGWLFRDSSFSSLSNWKRYLPASCSISKFLCVCQLFIPSQWNIQQHFTIKILYIKLCLQEGVTIFRCHVEFA